MLSLMLLASALAGPAGAAPDIAVAVCTEGRATLVGAVRTEGGALLGPSDAGRGLDASTAWRSAAGRLEGAPFARPFATEIWNEARPLPTSGAMDCDPADRDCRVRLGRCPDAGPFATAPLSPVQPVQIDAAPLRSMVGAALGEAGTVGAARASGVGAAGVRQLTAPVSGVVQAYDKPAAVWAIATPDGALHLFGAGRLGTEAGGPIGVGEPRWYALARGEDRWLLGVAPAVAEKSGGNGFLLVLLRPDGSLAGRQLVFTEADGC